MSCIAPAGTASVELVAEVARVVQASTSTSAAARVLMESDEEIGLILEALDRAAGAALLDEGSGSLRVCRVLGSLGREFGCDLARGRALAVAGQAYIDFGRNRRAVGLLRRAVSRLGRAQSPDFEHRAELRLVFPLDQLGRVDEAEGAALSAYAYFERAGSPHDRVSTRLALGVRSQRAERYREALLWFRMARRLEDVSRNLRAALASNTAVSLEAVQRYQASERHLTWAENAYREPGSPISAAQLRANGAHPQFVQGRVKAALHRYREAERDLAELGSARSVAQCRLERAEVLLSVGLVDRARRLAAETSAEFARLGQRKEWGQALQIGATAALVDRRAVELLDEARAIYAALGMGARLADVDMLTARALLIVGDTIEAAEHAAGAHEAFLRRGLVERTIGAEVLLATIDVALHRPARAMTWIDGARRRMRRVPSPWLQVELGEVHASALAALGREDEATEIRLRAVRNLEEFRGSLPPGEFMIAFLASKASLYAATVSSLVDAERIVEAFSLTERAKSRALLDMLHDASHRGARRTRSGALRGRRVDRQRRRADALVARLESVVADRSPAGKKRARALRAELRALRQSVNTALQAAWEEDAELASISAVGAVPPADVQRSLDADTTLLQYFVSATSVYVFVVTRDGFDAVAIDVPREDLERLLRRFQRQLVSHQTSDAAPTMAEGAQLRATRANLAAVHAVLIDPIADLLTTRRVVISPHGCLHGFPFHALPHDGGWLSDELEIWYAPSASVFTYCGQHRHGRATGSPTVLALPDADAPGIEEDAAAVADALGADTRLVLGEAATSDALREAARTSHVLHVATHGTYDSEESALSSIELADGPLTVYDAFDLDVRSDLVTLAACESGVAAVTRGDEVQGLFRGFLFAGAPRLLAGQWRIADQATSAFMRAFYGAARESGSWGSALRTAMRSVRAKHAHPYFWAPFFLIGHPGRVTGEGHEFQSGGAQGSVSPQSGRSS